MFAHVDGQPEEDGMRWWGDLRGDFLRHARVVNGMVALPDRPGLGIEIDEDVVRRYAV